MNIERQINNAFDALNEYDKERQNGREDKGALEMCLFAYGIGKQEVLTLVALVDKDSLWGIRPAFGRLVKIRAIVEKD